MKACMSRFKSTNLFVFYLYCSCNVKVLSTGIPLLGKKKVAGGDESV